MVVIVGSGAPLAGAAAQMRWTMPWTRHGEVSVSYLHPVSGRIVEAFGAFDQPYGPGNRGLDYAVGRGDVVSAAGPGIVAFAGPVAGRLFVTIQHRDGLRSSYSFLSRIDVRVGDSVAAGAPLGLTSDRFQLGMRRGSTYIDPAPLLGRRLVVRARLVVPRGFGGGAVNG